MFICDANIVGPWVYERVKGQWFEGRAQAIGYMRSGRLMAGVVYEDYNGANVVCHIAGEGNWATPAFLWAICDYPFNVLKVNRVTVPVRSDNEKSIRFVKRMGFKLEAELMQAIPGGNLLLFRMFKHDCKYLRDRYGKRFIATTGA